MRWLYFDKAGERLERDEFARLFENMKYRRIAEDQLPNGVRVSTVWMGIDHGPDEHGRPLIFETMAFGPPKPGDDYPDELDQRRSATEEQARRDHADVLGALKASGQTEPTKET